MSTKQKITVGCEVAFNKLDDATWFEVLAIENGYRLIVREAGTNYTAQFSDTSLVKQIRQPKKEG